MEVAAAQGTAGVPLSSCSSTRSACIVCIMNDTGSPAVLTERARLLCSLHQQPAHRSILRERLCCLLCLPSVASFLHENYLNFIHEDALEDVATAAAYMSDSGVCGGGRSCLETLMVSTT